MAGDPTFADRASEDRAKVGNVLLPALAAGYGDPRGALARLSGVVMRTGLGEAALARSREGLEAAANAGPVEGAGLIGETVEYVNDKLGELDAVASPAPPDEKTLAGWLLTEGPGEVVGDYVIAAGSTFAGATGIGAEAIKEANRTAAGRDGVTIDAGLSRGRQLAIGGGIAGVVVLGIAAAVASWWWGGK